MFFIRLILLFLPTPSARRATSFGAGGYLKSTISTHALREEGDNGAPCCRVRPCNFYPRPPRGGRRGAPCCRVRPCNFYPRPPRGGRPRGPSLTSPLEVFLPTPSARRATDFFRSACAFIQISTHALREEGDRPSAGRGCRPSNFYPRPPRGGRRSTAGRHYQLRPISTHALREEGDSKCAIK